MLDNAHRAHGPWHVVRKDTDENVLYATRHYAAEDKARDSFSAAAINWVAGEPPVLAATSSRGAGGGGSTFDLTVKVRHGTDSHAARVTLLEGGQSAHVQLARRDKGLAPGQFAAFYDGEVCLGSGVITEGAV